MRWGASSTSEVEVTEEVAPSPRRPGTGQAGLMLGARRLSTIRYDATDAEIEDVIEKSLDKGPKRREDDTPSRVLTTRREALSLYREILRITALFEWRNEQGVPWRDLLRESARKEFEAARFEDDPELVTRLLVVGRDSMHQVAERFAAKHTSVAGGGGPGAPPGAPPFPPRNG